MLTVDARLELLVLNEERATQALNRLLAIEKASAHLGSVGIVANTVVGEMAVRWYAKQVVVLVAP